MYQGERERVHHQKKSSVVGTHLSNRHTHRTEREREREREREKKKVLESPIEPYSPFLSLSLFLLAKELCKRERERGRRRMSFAGGESSMNEKRGRGEREH